MLDCWFGFIEKGVGGRVRKERWIEYKWKGKSMEIRGGEVGGIIKEED